MAAKTKSDKDSKEKKQGGMKATRYPGVYQRQSGSKTYEGKPDVAYIIDHKDPYTGKRIRKTVGSRSQGITLQYANQVRNALLEKLRKDVYEGLVPSGSPQDVPTLGEAWEKYKTDWLETKQKASAYTDVCYYKNHLLESVLHDRPLNKITVSDLEKLEAEKLSAGFAPQTVKTILGMIRRIMNKALKWKMWRGPSPFDDYEMPEVDNARTRYFSEEDVEKVFTTLKARNYRAWVMAVVAVQCGLRFSDIAKLEISDINFEDGTLFIRKPKNRKSRHVTMTQTVNEILQEWLQQMRSTLVFPSAANKPLWNVDDDFRDVVAELGLNDNVTENKDRLVFHSLRHTFASHLAKKGYTEIMLAKLLGHCSTEMTRRYTHLMPETQQTAASEIEELLKVGHRVSP